MRIVVAWIVVIGLVGCRKDDKANAGGGGGGAGGGAKVELEGVALRHLALEAYPMWAAKHPSEACPSSIEDLKEYVERDVVNDAWGVPRKWACGDTGFVVQSAGPDGKMDTADDIKSE